MLNDQAALSALARFGLTTRRKLLRAFWSTQTALKRGPDYGLAETYCDVLRVAMSHARRLNREAVFHDWLAALEWTALLRRDKSGLHKDAEYIRFTDDTILSSLAAEKRPVILAPIHMGCFPLVFARLMNDYFPARPMLILRAREDRAEETRAMTRISEIGSKMRFLNVANKQAYLDAVRFARDGAVVVVFLDLPGSYGGAYATTLFERQVRIALGIDSLARLTEASVLPLSVHSTIDGDELRVGHTFESVETGPVERLRISNIVRRHIEQSVLATPEQWHMWARFGEFLEPIEARRVLQ